MNSIVKVENLSFGYNKAKVLENVNFNIEKQDFVALIGPNGGGKTTLLKLMIGLLKPTTGNIFIAGEKLQSKKISIGYVPQNTNHNLDFPITVSECIATGFFKQKADKNKIEELLEQVQMEKYKNKRLGELSGGERQRVLVARALINEPEILFLDEPSSNMDVSAENMLFNMLAELNKKMTIILVSHDLMAISHHIKSVLCVNKNVHYHAGQGLSKEMMHEAYGCEFDLIAHGIPHRVLGTHDHLHGGCCDTQE